MKKSLVTLFALSTMGAVVAVGIVSSSAGAETTPASPAKTTKRKTPTDSVAVADSSSSSSTTTMSAAPIDATSTTSLPKAVAEAKPRKVFAELYSEGTLGKTDANNKAGAPSFDNFVGAKFDLGSGRSFYLRQMFQYNSQKGATGADGMFKMEPTVVQYLDSKLGHFKNDVNVTGIARVYLPTDDTERFQTKTMGSARGYLIFSKSYGKTDLAYVLFGQAYNYTQDTYISDDGTEAQNTQLRALNEFDAFYNFTSKFSSGLMVGTDSKKLRPLAGHGDYANKLYLEPAIQYAPSKQVFIQFYLDDSMQLINPSRPVTAGRDVEMTYDLNVTLTL